VCGEADPILFAKGSVFSNGVRSCVVSMNVKSPPINLRVEQKKFYEDITAVALGIKFVDFWKCLG
jgi:hypothetical protein